MDKKLYRSNRNNVLAGVCGGLGEYLGVDATIIRLAWVALVFLEGAGLLLYIIAAIVIPKKPSDYADDAGNRPMSDNAGYRDNNAGFIVGLVLIIIGALFLIRYIFPFSLIRMVFKFGWPILLIIIGLLIVFSSVRSKK